MTTQEAKVLAYESKRFELLNEWNLRKLDVDAAQERFDRVVAATRFRADGCLGREPIQMTKEAMHDIALSGCLLYEARSRLGFAKRLLDTHAEIGRELGAQRS